MSETKKAGGTVRLKESGETAGDECHEGGDWDIGQSHDVTPGVILLDCNAMFPEHDAAVAVSWKIFS